MYVLLLTCSVTFVVTDVLKLTLEQFMRIAGFCNPKRILRLSVSARVILHEHGNGQFEVLEPVFASSP